MKIQFRLRTLLVCFVLVCLLSGMILKAGKWIIVELDKKSIEGNEGVEVARYIGQHKGDVDRAFASMRQDFLAGQLPNGESLLREWKKPQEHDRLFGSALAYRSTLVHGCRLLIEKDLTLSWE